MNLDTTTTTASETICVQQEKKIKQERGRIITQPFLQIFLFFSSILDRTWRSPQQCRLITSDSRIFFSLDYPSPKEARFCIKFVFVFVKLSTMGASAHVSAASQNRVASFAVSDYHRQ